MIKKNEKINFNKFLFMNLIFIVLFVYGYNIMSSILLDFTGNKIFSNLAYQYSADYIFDKDFRSIKNIKKIEELGGWIFIINEDFSLDFISNEERPKTYEFKDIIDLNKGLYKYKNVKYLGSVKKMSFNNEHKYGVVVIPTKYVSNQVLLTPQRQNLGYFTLFFILRLILFILGTSIVIFIFSKILYGKLYKPLYELEEGFARLKEGDYSLMLDSSNESNIIEFFFIKKAFNSMTKSLKELQKERLENDKKRVQLFIDIRHDLKTPTTVIKGFSEALISNRISDKDSEKYLESINRNAVVIDTLLNELSEIIEYEDYSYNLNPVALDFCEYVRQSIIEFLPVFEQKDMGIKIDIPDKKILVEIDENIFARALKNLMKNIVDHNEKNTKVYFTIKTNKDDVILIIGDAGNKIDQDIAENIFEPFVTSDSSRNTSSKNRGLGLSITKKIVELHNGKIYLEQKSTGVVTKSFIIKLQKIK